MKQTNLFSKDTSEDVKSKYSTKIEAPIYEPKNAKPHLLELVDKQKTHRLIKEIDASGLPLEEKKFLIDAARRHNVFNYEKIADYYAHASKEMQYHMERSALVIIDFEKAIEYGYVKLCEEIRNQYLEEYVDMKKIKDYGILDEMSAYESFEDFYRDFINHRDYVFKTHGEVIGDLSIMFTKDMLRTVWDGR